MSLASVGHGRPLVVNLWSAQCAPCVSEMPDLEKLFHAYAGRVGFLGVDSQEAEAAGKPLARDTGVTYPLASDPDGEGPQLGALARPAHHHRGVGRRQGRAGARRAHRPGAAAGLARPGPRMIAPG